ncbi:DUF4337 family protein [Anaeromyxobacter paludicola]|uniref:DUF4337 domain-containing protein n=1 Tax=Anaeromyxobacter paludicola TaxID=2918171 RepID=A0ABN6N6L7_9BACT|nr:DUF4337 family protein [Anaeromyxobacter paludicola]BDG08824.1 hypothetical protein AMPC_19370 [Anaeromyxobacter paludicola]
MPDEPEIDTDALRERIDEELEREGGGLLRRIALTTAILAALAAITSLRAGATVNEALRLETEATRLQAEASDGWAHFQAKGVKGAVQDAVAAAWLAAGKTPPPAAADARMRYADEQEELAAKAREKERARDERTAEAGHLMHLHHRFALGVALFQVAIALGAVAALARSRLVWRVSLALGLGGLAAALAGLAG